jgi:hypothetical protein
MGVGIYPIFDPSLPGDNYDTDGKSLARVYERLDRLAVANGLKPLSAFGDNRPVPEGFDGDPDTLAEVLGPWDEWFPITEGIQTVEGLIRMLQSDRELARRVRLPEDVLAELEELRRCLRAAESKRTRFRLEMG